MHKPSAKYPVIGWWSGGITSAVACKLAIDLYGLENMRFIMLDTFNNEHPDTYRFQMDCEQWYGKEIEMIRNEKYNSIQDVWYRFNSLNVAHGAICSSELKREVRKKFLRENNYSHNIFGYEFTKREFNRALSMKLQYPETNPIFPLLLYGMDKEACINFVQEAGIEIPKPYREGYSNNNCYKTGCVQGGIGYWQKIRRDDPQKYDRMANVEHELTNLAGEPVTINKDQSKQAKKKPMEDRLVFLKRHPDYPDNKELSEMNGREPEPLIECNGFCGIDDLNENEVQTSLF